ncbi:MAG: DNA-3-methyladenine glycosylase 2 family protein [Pseudomonadota bacterium]
MSAPAPDVLAAACQALAADDPALARAYAEIGPPNWRVVEPGYAGLARIIAFQQISTRAAAAIWERVCGVLDEISAQSMLDLDEAVLRDCGMSRPKIAHLRSAAAAVVCGDLPLQSLGQLPVDEARERLLAVKGIGPWTADVFLLTATGALDAFPAGDVGLMESYRQLRGDAAKFEAKAFARQAETWRPYRGVAAHLLWDWLNHQRDRDVAPAPKA